MMKPINALFLVILISLLFSGCSAESGDPVVPPLAAEPSSANSEEEPQRILWGIWGISFNSENLTVVTEPLRNIQAHYNITDMLLPPACDDCLEIKVNSFDPITRILDADVTLRNPSQLTAYDIRGILYTDDAGHELINADDWTGLWDISGGGLINPFKAYAKPVDQRIFPPSTDNTENYLIYIPFPPQWENMTFAVDASWPSNCIEPYEITNFWQDPIYDFLGATGNIHIDVRDWQGDVNKVTLVAPEITGDDFTQFTHLSGDTWKLQLSNNTGVPAGSYKVRVISTSENSGSLALYDYITISITTEGVPSNPVDVTPGWLNFYPKGVCIDGNYVYVAADIHGLHIFDISEPANPIWVKSIDTPGYSQDVTVIGGYAYVTDGPTDYLFGEGLIIIDIDPLESAYIVRTIGMDYGQNVCVEGSYAFVADGHSGLRIIDIDPLESANIIKTVKVDQFAFDVAVSGGYAYVTDYNYGLKIIDIEPPESAHIINEVNTEGNAMFVDVSGGYAYVRNEVYGFRIIDIDPPESAHVVNNVGIQTDAHSVRVTDGFAYLAEGFSGLHVVDIDPPESAYIVKVVEVPGITWDVAISGGYAYVASALDGLHVIDIDPIESAYVVKAIDTVKPAKGIDISNGYAYTLSNPAELQFIDVDPPHSSHVVNSVETQGWNSDFSVEVEGGYAYVTDWYIGVLQIIDIDPQGSPSIVNNVEIQHPLGIEVQGGYAYVADRDRGLQIIDVDPPESAYIIKEVITWWPARELAVSGEYAYLVGGGQYDGNLVIIDIDPISSANVIKVLDMEGAVQNIALSGSYAYVTGWDYKPCLLIIDIDPPEMAHIVNTVSDEWEFFTYYGVATSDGYAYVVASVLGLLIIDVDPVDSAHIIETVYFPEGQAFDVVIEEGHAYIADKNGGLRIIRLW